jgi:cytochrome c553
MRDAVSKARVNCVFIVTIMALAAAVPARAGSPPALAGLCASCHGVAGLSPVATYPNIAGQNEGYIAYALKQYQTHQRLGAQAGMMAAVAAQLSPSDISALAAYYASLKSP